MRKKLPDGMLRSGKRSPFLIISIRLFTEVCHIEKYPRRGGLRGAGQKVSKRFFYNIW
jgi:hypothetical protein